MVKGWTQIPIADVGDILSGGTPSTSIASYWGGDFAWCTPSDITEQKSKYISKTEKKITQQGLENSSATLLPAGTILICTRATIGEMAIASTEITTNQGFKNLICYKKYDREFIYYALHELKREMTAKAFGSTFLEISKKELGEILVSMPEEVKEQKEIATALSDVDELILNLEKLIEKKSAIKLGVMQQLITGKKRLPGYKGEWKTINMSEKSKLKARIGWQGLTTAEYQSSGYSYLITGTDFENGRIDWSHCHYVSFDRWAQDPNIQVANGDVLLTKDGTIGKVALVDGLEKPATLNSGVFVIRPLNSAYSARFLYYVLSSSVFDEFLDKLAAGSTISHLYQKDLVEFEFDAPPTIEEQEDIASLIYDMECEIRELKVQLTKYRYLKTGMMNELLTGKTRLV